METKDSKTIAKLEKKLLNEIEKNSKSIDSLKNLLLVKSKEVDQLQIDIKRPRKWWKNSSTLISIAAILLSVFATVYSINKENQKELSDQKLRIKEIVKRLSDIQTSWASAGEHLGPIQQSTMAEVLNLVDEAVIISKIDYSYLNDAEYSTIISMAYTINNTENLEELLNNALKTVNDIPTEYAIKNWKARYHFFIDDDVNKGRELIKEVIEISRTQKISKEMKTVNIAMEYRLWSSFEFEIREHKKADSLLKIAENLIIYSVDSVRFKNYPAYGDIIYARKFLDESGLIK